MIGQRAIVHQAQILTGIKRMGALGGDRALGRHAGMPDHVATGHLGDREPVDDIGWCADFLVDFQAAAGAHDVKSGRQTVKRLAQFGGHTGGLDQGVGGEMLKIGGTIDGGAQIGDQRRPIHRAIGVKHTGLGAPAGVLTKHREPGAVRATATHLDKHRREQTAKARAQRLVFEE